MVFILQHGGKDLESFALSNFDEARSLLVQVCLSRNERIYQLFHGGFSFYMSHFHIKCRLLLGLLWLNLHMNLNIGIFIGESIMLCMTVFAIVAFCFIRNS